MTRSISLMDCISSRQFKLPDEFVINVRLYKDIILRIDFINFGRGRTLPEEIIKSLGLDLYHIAHVKDQVRLHFFECDCSYDKKNKLIVKH
jgi:hypothetical protein